jgi:O-antigen/teichoic acid export membrane protein
LFLFPEQIILLILGEKWLSATSTLRVLAIFGSVRAISGSSSALFLALKKQRYVTIVTLVSILGLAIPIVPLVLQYQTVGAAIAVICGTFIAVPVVVYYLRKVLFDS